MKKHIHLIFISILIPFSFLSCSEREPAQVSDPSPAFVQFFNHLALECNNAYAGSLQVQPAHINMFTGTEEMQMHFRECHEDHLKIPFHIENESDGSWDRSRTWILTLHEEGLELRHDHRKADGSDDDVTMYGGFSEGEGTEFVQRFRSGPRTEEADGAFRGWRIEYVPGERYTYGTIWEDEWNIMVQFDLSEAIETPPAPWGHD
ncbi:MAG: hypothetical protein EA360_11500 [Balneolaceae bacterium]|nr:MAG: hypothetical protein EA360_11500 [Balneolaceae bacterium]